jgi:hypothetical protein
MMMEGTRWFRRFCKEVTKMSPDIRIVRIKYGFYRIYYKQGYLHEVYKDMPEMGYDIEEVDPRFESQSYYEEFEDQAELTRKIKNYVEGYWDSLDRIRTRFFMIKNHKEFNERAANAYKQMVVK